jgi:hypothetical protein
MDFKSSMLNFCIRSISGQSLSPSINADDFNVLAHPIQRQIDPTGVSGRFDFLFDHFFPEDSELGFGGFAGILQIPAALFRARFSFQGDHILLWLVIPVDFFSACIHCYSRLAPADFPMTEGWLCNQSNLFMISLTNRAGPEFMGGLAEAIN